MGTVDSTLARTRQGVRPTDKKDVCNWSISVARNKETGRWHVVGNPEATYMHEHNHKLQPTVTNFMARKEALPREARQFIRTMAKYGMTPYNILRAAKGHFSERQQHFPLLSLEDIVAISRDITPQTRDQGQMNASAKALSILQDLQRIDPNWVVSVR